VASDVISVEELRARLAAGLPTVLIDVRLGKVGTIPGAVSVPVTDLEDAPREWDRDALLVVFCQHGRGASEYAQEVLRDQGYPHVVRLLGGVDAWIAAGGPTAEPEDGGEG
jgi:thiosulfate sulfurtransferase